MHGKLFLLALAILGCLPFRSNAQSLDFGDVLETKLLRRLYESLQLEILSTMDALNELYESSDYTLYQLSTEQPNLLEDVAIEQAKAIEVEIAQLKETAKNLYQEINVLTGTNCNKIK